MDVVEETIELGDRVKDVRTGFTGIVMGLVAYKQNNPEAGIDAETLQDGIPVKRQWIDLADLVVVAKSPTPLYCG